MWLLFSLHFFTHLYAFLHLPVGLPSLKWRMSPVLHDWRPAFLHPKVPYWERRGRRRCMNDWANTLPAHSYFVHMSTVVKDIYRGGVLENTVITVRKESEDIGIFVIIIIREMSPSCLWVRTTSLNGIYSNHTVPDSQIKLCSFLYQSNNQTFLTGESQRAPPSHTGSQCGGGIPFISTAHRHVFFFFSAWRWTLAWMVL